MQCSFFLDWMASCPEGSSFSSPFFFLSGQVCFVPMILPMEIPLCSLFTTTQFSPFFFPRNRPPVMARDLERLGKLDVLFSSLVFFSPPRWGVQTQCLTDFQFPVRPTVRYSWLYFFFPLLALNVALSQARVFFLNPGFSFIWPLKFLFFWLTAFFFSEPPLAGFIVVFSPVRFPPSAQCSLLFAKLIPPLSPGPERPQIFSFPFMPPPNPPRQLDRFPASSSCLVSLLTFLHSPLFELIYTFSFF